MSDRDETGKFDSSISVNGEVIPATSKDFSNDTETADSEFDDKPEKDKAVTGYDRSVTLEADGSKADLENTLFQPNGEVREGIVTHIRGSENGHRFSGCIPSLTREYPGDGKTTTEVEMEAQGYRRT